MKHLAMSCCVLSVFAAIPTSVGAQSLRDAIDQALRTSPQIASAEASLEAALEQRNGTSSQARMRVQAEAATGLRRDVTQAENRFFPPTTTTLNRQRTTAGITVSQQFYSGGRLREALSVSAKRIEIAQLRVASAQLTTARNAAAVYSDLARALSVSETLAESQAALSDDKAGADARFRAGEVSLTDVAQSDARYASLQSQSARAVGDLQGARAVFERFVGTAPLNIERDLPRPAPPPTLLAYLDEVGQNNLELGIARLEVELARSEVQSAATQRNPRASVDATFERRWGDLFRESQTSVGQVTARVVVPLWDGGATSSAVREAIARGNVARFDLADLEREVRAAATRQWADYQASTQVVSALRAQVNAAELARRGASAELRFGLRSTIEALNQELELRQAKTSLAAALRDEYIDFIDLMTLMGRNPLGFPAQSIDPIRRSAVPLKAVPRPRVFEQPLVTVLEVLETNDAGVSRTTRALNTLIEPDQRQGPTEY
jgi:outer membrane protein